MIKTIYNKVVNYFKQNGVFKVSNGTISKDVNFCDKVSIINTDGYITISLSKNGNESVFTLASSGSVNISSDSGNTLFIGTDGGVMNLLPEIITLDSGGLQDHSIPFNQDISPNSITSDIEFVYRNNNLGVGINNPLTKVHIVGTPGDAQLTLGTPFTPSGGPVSVPVGTVAWDDDFIYIVTSVGWKKTALSVL